MNWTAVVPLKCGPERKTRLAAALSPAEREALSDQMAEHVLTVLKATPQITIVLSLTPRPPHVADVLWIEDKGRGLNEELTALRATYGDAPLLIVHGDLPLLRVEDVSALLAAAEVQGAALAPDRLGQGTNALALMPTSTGPFVFGAGSCFAHRTSISPSPVIVVREGLSHDVDTPEDLDLVVRLGATLGLSSPHCLA